MKSLCLSISLFFTTVLFAQQPGTLDASFGRGGRVWDTVGRNAEYPAMLVQPDDKIIIGGSGFRKGTNAKTFRIDRCYKNGGLDKTFGDSGTVLVKFSLSNNEDNHQAFITTMALQPDGKIIAAGTYKKKNDYYGTLIIMRFLPNGNIDSTFGADGMAMPDVRGTSEAADMALQADGKIVIGGLNAINSNNVFFIERLLPNGLPDRSFGNDGKVRDTQGTLSSLAIQPDGKIVTGGTIYGAPHAPTRILIRRYLPNGLPDLDFGKKGAVDTALGVFESWLSDIALQPDGKIIGVGGADAVNDFSPYMVLVRYQPDGKIDKTFGGGGITRSPYLVFFNEILLWKDKILLAGTFIPDFFSNASDFAMAAFDTNGLVDSSFATNGLLTTNVDFYDYFNSAALQSDGKIVYLGTAQGISIDFSVRNMYRYNGYPAQNNLMKNSKITTVKNVVPQIVLSPNPGSNYVQINGLSISDKTAIIISDALGKTMAVYSTNNAAQYRCDVSKLVAGVYYLQINSAGKTEVLKFIKE